MPRMVRKQIYIESLQDNNLKKQARDLGITEAEVIRRAIDRQMTSVRFSIRDLKAWERERAFIAKRVAKGHASGGREWKREDAYEERMNRGLAPWIKKEIVEQPYLFLYLGSFLFIYSPLTKGSMRNAVNKVNDSKAGMKKWKRP